MADITLQPWYLPEGTYAENIEAFKEYLVSLGTTYSELTDIQKAAVQDFREDLDLMEYVRIKKVNTFLEAKDSAFTSLRTEHDIAIQALGVLWQAAEDNDYELI